MHELLVAGGGVIAGYASAAYARLRWRLTRIRAPLAIGDEAPAFRRLPAADGRSYSLRDFRDKRAVVIEFMSNTCPGVKAYDGRMRELAKRFGDDVAFIGINPIDDRLYPRETLAEMKAAADERSLAFPYLKDVHQEVGRAYGAICTPQVFVLDGEHRLRYRGRVDDAMLENRVKKRYLERALESILDGEPPKPAETAPLGCSIAWTRPRRRGMLHALNPRQRATAG